MTRPATGTTASLGGYMDLDPKNLFRGKLQGVFVRDARGLATDISPHDSTGAVKWSPFAEDGKLRDDLFAFRLVDGFWQANTVTANEGFHQVGAFKKGEGPKRSPKVDSNDFEIEQDNFPFDTAITSEGEPFSFTAVETVKDVVRRLRNDLRLSSDDGTSLVALPGTADAGWGKPIGADPVDRQVLLWHSRSIQGKSLDHIIGYSRAKLTNIGESKFDKEDSDASELTYTPLPDGIFMAQVDGEYRPVLTYEWIGGPAWAAMKAATP